MSIFQMILISSWAGISGNYFMDYLGFARPVVCGPIVGLILGDIKSGIIMSAVIESMFLGTFTVGAALAPDYNLASIVGVALGISSGVGVEAAVALALPVAFLGQFLMMSIVYPGNLFLLHKADVYAEEGKVKQIETTYLMGGLLWFLKGFIPTFLALYFGSPAVKKLFEALPNWLVDGFSIVGGILPAVGFAMLIDVIGDSKGVWALFAVGFILVSYLNLDIIALAVLASVFAYLYISKDSKREVI
ncbi:PTS sugar transporter subunit IIC [Anaerosalibacter massiliensis]|uniref:PTS sugar transporter subunit IIC n=1 Tax=Anaerosalibacter massiliensis TaxID=1347392 RepID=A0A9X2MKM8_9FIRM|nr:PTS sugar transporter subunit IIC [Anaerosalibacter massiliensis]MCR2045349.1 PTS sugar transporter subunit IIC [Anaerosalibacter massiliensis]